MPMALTRRLAGIDLGAMAEGSDEQRLTDLAQLESTVCERLPASMRRSKELVDLAIGQLGARRFTNVEYARKEAVRPVIVTIQGDEHA